MIFVVLLVRVVDQMYPHLLYTYSGAGHSIPATWPVLCDMSYRWCNVPDVPALRPRTGRVIGFRIPHKTQDEAVSTKPVRIPVITY
jgi:hypothetical protein